MKTHRCILLLLFLATSAFAQDVTYNFDSAADFSRYKTYRWAKHPQSVDIDQITLNKLSAAFDDEFAKKGLTRTGSATSDLVIVYQLAVTHEKEINSYSTGWAGGAGWGGAYGTGTTTSTVSTISIGSLNLDIYDASKKRLVWRGVATKTLDPKVKPEKQDKNIAKAAQKLLKNYPPKVK